MENLLIPTTGIRSRFFRFLKKAFQRSLICLVIFCFSFAPLPNTINLFAQEAVIDQGSNQALLPLPDDHVDSQINPNDMGLVGPESEVSTDISNLPTLDKSSPDQNTPEVSNPEETPGVFWSGLDLSSVGKLLQRLVIPKRPLKIYQR